MRRGCVALAASALLLGGCETLPASWTSLTSWMGSLPTPSLSWLGIGKGPAKPGPLPAYENTAVATINWQVALGAKGGANFAPAVLTQAIYASAPDGTIVSVDPATGRQNWRIKADKPLQAGIGASPAVVAVGTDKGDVLAFDGSGKPLWQAKVSSEVAGPPKAAEGKILVWSLDGKIFAFAETDGSQKWVYQRLNPSLTVRRFVGGTVTRGGLFTGTAGGKLLALDVDSGRLGWEANVATPKGATELERIADVTSLPVVDAREVCAVAFQGRVACFELQRGTLVWSRDFSSLAGLAIDNEYLYLTDDKGAVLALDKTTGASVWKQDKLAARFPSGPVRIAAYVGVVDAEGYLHLLDRSTGALLGRVATDGTAALSQPIGAGDAVIWQSTGGNLFSVSAK
jgi:outer membrane protein assembly factor BamB